MTRKPSRYPTTLDGRYFVVHGRLWRCTNPTLPEPERARWVRALMAARRAVRKAKQGSPADLAAVRRRVHEAKVALGERGAPSWTDGAPDFNRRKVENTPYAAWFAALETQ